MRTTKNFRVLHAIEKVQASPRKSPRPALIDSFSQAVSKFQIPSSIPTKKPDCSSSRTDNSTSPLRYYPQRSQNAANLAKLNIFCAPYFQDDISNTNRSEVNRGNQTHNKSQSESDISPFATFRSRLGLPEKSQDSANASPVFSLRRLNNSQTPTSHLKAFEKQIKRSSIISQSSTSGERLVARKRNTMLSTLSNESADSSSPSKKLMNLPLHLATSPANKKPIRPIIIPRASKVDKILDQVRQSSGLQKAPELSSTKDNTPLKTESNADDLSPYGFVPKRIVTEGDQKISFQEPLKFHDISQKLIDYRILFKTQSHDLEKVRAPFTQRKETASRQHRMSISKRTIPPQQKKKIKMKLAKKILQVLKKMSLLNLTIDEIIQYKVFPSTPYEHEGSKELFDYVKSGDILKVAKTLKQNKYFVYDFDHAGETCLHWAAKRNFAAIVKLLLEKGADPNAVDLTARTPLFLAAKGEFQVCIKLLLYHGADPTLRSQNNKLAKDYTKDPETQELLEKAHLMHEKLSPLKTKDFKKNWDLLDKTAFRVKIVGVGVK